MSTHVFENLEIWKEARKLVREIRAICKKPPAKNDSGFVDQITRSVRSISANIAEGAEAQTNPEFIQFLGYAKRSAGEVRAHLYDALDEQYINQEHFNRLVDQAAKLGRMIGSMIRYLAAHRRFKPATRDPQPATRNHHATVTSLHR